MVAYEALQKVALKPYFYAELLFYADSRPADHQSLLAKIREHFSLIGEKLIFFELEILLLGNDRFEQLVAENCLGSWKHYLRQLRKSAPYSLSENGALSIEYRATTDKATPINLTNHSYFNLSGAGEGDILDHQLQIAASNYSVTDPRGTLLEKRPIDPNNGCSFLQSRTIREAVNEIAHQHGDNYFIDRPSKKELIWVARLQEPVSGRSLEVWSTEDCLQLYISKYLSEDIIGKQGKSYPPFSALCLECQGYSDGMNTPQYGNCILQPEDEYYHQTIYQLST